LDRKRRNLGRDYGDGASYERLARSAREEIVIPTNAAPLGLALLGLVLGIRHATDSDHVIAVTTIVTQERRLGSATRIGMAWGIGHMTTILIVGGAIIFFKLTVPPRVGLTMEFAVALVLIGLGLSTLFGNVPWLQLGRRLAGEPTVHSHGHQHGELGHSHPHAHQAGLEQQHEEHRIATAVASFRGWALKKALAVGFAHGLAGSAAIALLVLGAIPDPLWAAVYLVVFGFGTVIGMVLITTAIGVPIVLSANRMVEFNHMLAAGSGLLSLGFGLVLAYQIGVVDGLFGSMPVWVPH
jgi:high-affinity nickel-transport protein